MQYLYTGNNICSLLPGAVSKFTLSVGVRDLPDVFFLFLQIKTYRFSQEYTPEIFDYYWYVIGPNAFYMESFEKGDEKVSDTTSK